MRIMMMSPVPQPSPEGEGGDGRVGARPGGAEPRCQSSAPSFRPTPLAPAGASRPSPRGKGLLLVVGRLLGVLADLLGAQKRVDLGRLVEAGVAAEAQVGCELQVHAV